MSVSSLDPNNALMAAIKQLSSNVASQRTISPFKNNNNGGSTADFEEVARKASGNFTKKLENFDRKRTKEETLLSGYKELGEIASSFTDAMKAVTKKSPPKVSISENLGVTAVVSGANKPQNYSVNVNSVATKSRWIAEGNGVFGLPGGLPGGMINQPLNAFPSPNVSVVSSIPTNGNFSLGIFTITHANTVAPVTLVQGDTLNIIADKINTACGVSGIDATARVEKYYSLGDVEKYRLVLESDNLGYNINVAPDPQNIAIFTNVSQYAFSQNASITVNNLLYESDNNTFTNIAGLASLTVTKNSNGTITTGGRDWKTNLQNLVESANTASDFIKKHKALDSDKKPVSDLYFSPYLRELQASINRLTSLRSTLTGSSIKTIADLGITSVNGQFLVDVDQFNSVTSNSQNFKEIDALFFDHFSGSTSVVGNGGAEGVFNAFAHVNTHGKGFLEVDAGNMADSCLEVEIKHMANNAVNTDYEVRVDGVLQNIAVNTASGEITITSPPGAPVIRLQYYPHVNFPVGAIDKIYTSYTGPGVRVANNAKLEINTLGKLANLRSDDLQIVVTNRGLGNFGASLIYKGVLYNMETTYISDTMLMLNGPVGSAIDGLSIVYSSDVALDENQSNIFTNLTFGKSPYNKEYNNINNITSTLASEIRRQESKLTNLATKSTKLKARREEAVNKAVMKAQMLEMKKQMAEQTMKMISTILTGAASAA